MPFLGMRGTGDWVNNQRIENWRQKAFELFPNGQAPLTAVLSMMPSSTSIDPRLNWWEKTFPTQRATITNIWLDAALTIPYNAAAPSIAGTTVYVRMSQPDVERFIETDVVLLRLSTDLTLDVHGHVISTIANAANSYIAVMLLENDLNSQVLPTPNRLNSADVVWIIGTANAEGSNSPTSWMQDPFQLFNYCQIFKDAVEHTNTALKTKLRTDFTGGDFKAEARREALEAHVMKIEKASIFGRRDIRGGANGKPLRYMGGIRDFIQTNQYDYTTDPTVAGMAWATGGEQWFDNLVEAMFRWGPSEKLALCGSGALAAIQVLVKARGSVELTAKPTSYGIKVATWETVFGTVHFKTHPLFTMEPTTRFSMLFIDPKNLAHIPFRDTVFQENIQANDADEKKDQYLTEIGMEVYLERTHGWADNVGLDNNMPA